MEHKVKFADTMCVHLPIYVDLGSDTRNTLNGNYNLIKINALLLLRRVIGYFHIGTTYNTYYPSNEYGMAVAVIVLAIYILG